MVAKDDFSLNKILADTLEDLSFSGVNDFISWQEESITPSVEGSQIKRAPTNIREKEHMKKELPQIPSSIEIDYNREPEEVLAELAAMVSQCTRCPDLVANRSKTVFGTGNPRADLVFLGEGPGADEDRLGLPFVGRSGQLLTDIITKGMKLKREDIYICNIVRCRPPKNRVPLPPEANCCRPFLEATLKVIAPKYICCLGATAATNLLHQEAPIGKFRGNVYDWNNIKVVCTYHPAYLLRNPAAKVQTWEDIKLLMRTMGLTPAK